MRFLGYNYAQGASQEDFARSMLLWCTILIELLLRIILCKNICFNRSYSLSLVTQIVPGDFNCLDVKSIQSYFRLKPMVKKPTRKDLILDFVLTNLHNFYEEPQHFPPFGLSDHRAVTVESLKRENCGQPCKFVLKRDTREIQKAELGRYLSVIDW